MEIMAQMQANRDDRIELRATRDEKRLLTAAAAHERLDAERDSLRVLDLLENPPAPTPVLLAAARRRIARGGKGA